MPARDFFFKRADFGRPRGRIGCFAGMVYNAGTLSFLTSYRPNFCAGWRRAIAAIALVIFGMLIGRISKRDSPPIVIQRTIDSAVPGASATPVIEEKVYTCGARTKKGKPCSRRVKQPGRCWQHKG
ncbi:MAG TPA: hypothetical protein VFR78_16300 [Pyrinomonadaceae bacterium]|nr:hypothetical protein [Pyrinomonadaceae bacterium]